MPPAPKRRLTAAVEVPGGSPTQRRISRTAKGNLTTEAHGLAEEWQRRALEFYDTIGEVHYVANFVGDAMARHKLVVQELEDGIWRESKDDRANGFLSRMGGSLSNPAEMQRMFGVLRFLTGEKYLLITADGEGEDRSEIWEIVSPEELRIEEKKITRTVKRLSGSTQQGQTEGRITYDRVAPGGVIRGNKAVVYRFFRRHPRFSGMADSPMRGVLDILDELQLLDRAVRMRARSRAQTGGVWLVPDEISFTSTGRGSDDDPESDDLMSSIIEAFTAVVDDESGPSAGVPILLRVNSEMIEKFKDPIKFSDPQEAYPEIQQRKDAVKRFGQGVNLPVELVTGLGSTSFRNAWLLDESTYDDSLKPLATEMADEFTIYLFRFWLKQQGEKAPERFRLWADPKDLITRPDRTKDAHEARKQGVLSAAAYLKVLGFDVSDQMADDEYEKWVGLQVNDGGMAIGKGPTPAQPLAEGRPHPPGGVKDRNVGRTDRPSGDAAAERSAILVAVHRAREAAGNKILTRAQRKPAAFPALGDVPRHAICATLAELRGEGWFADNDINIAELVRGSFEPLLLTLRDLGTPDPESIVAAAERFAVETLLQSELNAREVALS